MDFSNIQKQGFWSDVANDLNENFNRIGAEIDKLIYKTEKSKGLFIDKSELTSRYPKPEDGDWALVGSSFPVKVYYATRGVWIEMNSTWDGGGIVLTDYIKSTKLYNLTELL